jgi:transcriptional regulator with GAF, ATPase, and Fis domain
MKMMGETPTAKTTLAGKDSLDRRSWQNWFLLVGVLLITTIVLTTAILPLVSQTLETLWFWPKTDLVLLFGLSLLMLAFATYLTDQQRQLAAIRKRLEHLQEEANERSRRDMESRLFALLNVSHIMGSEADLQSVFDCITKMCVENFKCQQASLMLFDRKTEELVVRSAIGHLNASKVFGARRKVGEGIAGVVAEHREPLLVGPNSAGGTYPGLQFKAKSLYATMLVPIMHRDGLVGIINVSSRSPDANFTSEDLRALQVFAENAATCIRHSERVEQMKESNQKFQDTLEENNRLHQN